MPHGPALCLKGGFGIVLMLSFGLMIVSFASVNVCYTNPCMEGQGMGILWSVDSGQSFEVIILSIATLASGLFSIHALFRTPYTPFMYGSALTVIAGLAATCFFQMMVWANKTVMIEDLAHHAGSSLLFYQSTSACNGTTPSDCISKPHCAWENMCVRSVKLDVAVKSRFEAAAVLFGLLMAIQMMLLVFLLMWRDMFTSTAAPPIIDRNQESSSYDSYNTPVKPSASYTADV